MPEGAPLKTCHACGRDLQVKGRISRTEQCPFCRADLHCCKSCSFFDPAQSKQCREPAAELVRDKTKANFCDFFSFAEGRSNATAASDQKARKDLEALFRKPE